MFCLLKGFEPHTCAISPELKIHQPHIAVYTLKHIKIIAQRIYPKKLHIDHGAITSFFLYCSKGRSGDIHFEEVLVLLDGWFGLVWLCHWQTTFADHWLCAHMQTDFRGFRGYHHHHTARLLFSHCRGNWHSINAYSDHMVAHCCFPSYLIGLQEGCPPQCCRLSLAQMCANITSSRMQTSKSRTIDDTSNGLITLDV